MDFLTLNLLFRCNKKFSHEKIRSHDLTDTECMICTAVYSSGECSQDDVVKTLCLDKTTVAKAVQKLEARGLLFRKQDAADKRKKVLQITEAGKDRISGIMNLHDKWLATILPCLSLEEQKQFESYCVRLLHAAEALLSDQKNK